MEPHQQRVIEEKTELDNKIDKLEKFTMTELYRSLPQDEQDRLRLQHTTMGLYSTILSQRIERFT